MTKVAATVATAPTREVKVAGRNNTKNPSVNGNSNNMNTRQIREADNEALVKSHNLLTASDDSVSWPIITKAKGKHEQVDHWLCGAISPVLLSCIQDVHDPEGALMALIVAISALIYWFISAVCGRLKAWRATSAVIPAQTKDGFLPGDRQGLRKI
jgi:hypothetical protein